MSNQVTMKDVARKVGVSINTVSRAINDKSEIDDDTKEKVLEAVEELGFRPNKLAQGLSSDKTDVIGIIVPDNDNPFFSAVVKGIERKAEGLDYSVILSNTAGDYAKEEEAIEVMKAEQVDGILIAPVQTHKETIIELSGSRLPFVLLARYFRDLNVDYVTPDDEQVGYQAVEHLINQGSSRIGIINGPSCVSSSWGRIKGYRTALKDYGIEEEKKLVRNDAISLKDGYLKGKDLLEMSPPRPEAIFAFNDIVAIGAMKAIREKGLSIPEDIAVIGCDNIFFSSYLAVPLTTIETAKTSVGKAAVEVLHRKLNDNEEDENELISKNITPELIVRSST